MKGEVVKILVVDDEPWIHKSCQKVLVPEGYEIASAEDGPSGLQLFQKRDDFAAALIDIKMPGMDGIELVGRIHELDEDAVLLIITGHATIETAVEAIKRGAYDYIPKPFTPDELIIPLKRGLEQRALKQEARRLLLDVARERSRSNSIITCMRDGVLVVNRDSQVVLANNAAAKICREVASQALPLALTSLNSQSLAAVIEGALTSAPGPLVVSQEIVLGDGTFAVSVSPIIDTEQASGAVAVLHDISERKKLETAKSMFVSWVAHEIKAPLAAVEGLLTLVVNDSLELDDTRKREFAERSLLRLTALRHLVEDLTSLTALETGHFPIKREKLDIGEVVKEVVQSCTEKARNKKIRLELLPFPEPKQVLADRNAIRIVVNNLVDNAIKYTPDSGKVQVLLGEDNPYTVVSVKDNGIGMTRDECKQVFEEFFRAKNKYTENIPGTGLGLNIVKQLIDRHDGKITVKSALRKGTTFTVYLPTL